MTKIWRWLFSLSLNKLANDSNYIARAKREFKALGYDLEDNEEGPNKWLMEGTFDLLKVFASQGHSGFSASYAIKYFTLLAEQKPLSPLTGKDDEWDTRGERGEGTLYQNNRSSRVFKDSRGAYDINGKVFVDEEGSSYTKKESRVYVKFPYIPKTEYVKEAVCRN